MIYFIFLCVFLFSSKINCHDYEGYKVIKAIPKTEAQISVLKNILISAEYDVWSYSRVLGSPWVFMTGPTEAREMKMILTLNDIIYRELDSNIAITLQALKDINKLDVSNETIALIEHMREERSTNNNFKKKKFKLSMDKYHHYPTMTAYMEYLAEKYPEKVEVYTIGQTVEDRLIQGVKIFSAGSKKPAILIDAGIHGREWLAPATALQLINQLAENAEYEYMLNKVDWYIFPSINPDGYEYSLNEDPLWRKTRSEGKFCHGVDANRNFDYHWNGAGTVSRNECSNTYIGQKPFSEIETESLARFALERKDQLKLYISLHSYGQLILYPWSWAPEKISNYKEQQLLGEQAAKAIKNIRGTYYQVGTPPELLYRAPGCSVDWMANMGVPLAYCIELPSFDEQFHPPPRHTRGVVKEILKAMEVFHEYVKKKWGTM